MAELVMKGGGRERAGASKERTRYTCGNPPDENSSRPLSLTPWPLLLPSHPPPTPKYP